MPFRAHPCSFKKRNSVEEEIRVIREISTEKNPCTFREVPCSLKKRNSVEKEIRVIREIRTEKEPSVVSVKFRT